MKSQPSVIGRAGLVLRAVASKEPEGTTTTLVAEVAGLPRPTVHRLLTALAEEGLVERDDATADWHLGPECFLLGAAAAARYDVSPAARAAVRRLAGETGESAFFSVRRGGETVCLIREDGSFPVRSHVLHEGIRFPLGVASAGMAILAFLPDRERDAYIRAASLVDDFGSAHDVDGLLEQVRATRTRGFAVNPGLIVEGSWGLGAAVFDAYGAPRWALSLTGIEARLAPPRQDQLGQRLMREAHLLAEAMRVPH